MVLTAGPSKVPAEVGAMQTVSCLYVCVSTHLPKCKSGLTVATVVAAMCLRFPCGGSDAFQTGNRSHRQPCEEGQSRNGRRQGVRKWCSSSALKASCHQE